MTVQNAVAAFSERMEIGIIDERYMHSEVKHFDALQPFYDHLEQTVDTLQRKPLPDERVPRCR